MVPTGPSLTENQGEESKASNKKDTVVSQDELDGQDLKVSTI